MFNTNDTIYALATVKGKSGIAVIRVSGKDSHKVLRIICKRDNFIPRMMTNAKIYADDEIIDNALVVFFASPKSFTGEDVIEFHIHSSLAIIKKLIHTLSKIENVRLADRGEFSRRAVLNGKMDLTEAEGLLDLINAETEVQRKIALKQYSGEQRKIFENWRLELTKTLAYMEAYLDFPEEEISATVTDSIQSLIERLVKEISAILATKANIEAIRTGYKIAIIGKPNSGKSSLLNAITKRNVAIVSDIEGTTRDIIEAYIDIDGYPVTFLDTAGIRKSNDIIEAEGVKRALIAAQEADLILLLSPALENNNFEEFFDDKDIDTNKIIYVKTKADLLTKQQEDNILYTSTKVNGGIDNLIKVISEKISSDFSSIEDNLLTRERHRQALSNCLDNLLRAKSNNILPLKAEDLRLASRSLAEITGAVTTDDLLDVIFGDFCIGK